MELLLLYFLHFNYRVRSFGSHIFLHFLHYWSSQPLNKGRGSWEYIKVGNCRFTDADEIFL